MMHGDPHARRKFFDDLAGRWDDMHPREQQLPAVEWGLGLAAPLEDRVVVDLGCGTGIVTRQLLPRIGQGRIIAIDLSDAMLVRASRGVDDPRVQFVRGDMLSCGLPSSSVDLVLCYNTFPHFADAAAAVRELRRWLRPGGSVLVWHDAGRATINEIHHGVGGAVGHDMLPPARQVGGLFEREGMRIAVEEDTADRYAVLARDDDRHGSV